MHITEETERLVRESLEWLAGRLNVRDDVRHRAALALRALDADLAASIPVGPESERVIDEHIGERERRGTEIGRGSEGDLAASLRGNPALEEAARRAMRRHAYVPREGPEDDGRTVEPPPPDQQVVQVTAVDWGPASDLLFDGTIGGVTVRACLDCGCLCVGGATRCGRCAREELPTEIRGEVRDG